MNGHQIKLIQSVFPDRVSEVEFTVQIKHLFRGFLTHFGYENKTVIVLILAFFSRWTYVQSLHRKALTNVWLTVDLSYIAK